jgi:hypothetical protein
MDINECAKIVAGVEEKRHPFVISVIELIYTIPVERKEVQPQLDALKEKHIKCMDLAVEFFNGKNAMLKYSQNFDNWWEANRQLYKYLPMLFNDLKQRFPDCIFDELVNQDYESVLWVGNAYKN